MRRLIGVLGLVLLGWATPAAAQQPRTPAEVLDGIAAGVAELRALLVPSCTFTVSPADILAPAAGARIAVTVTASAPTCAWTAGPTPTWLSLDAAAGTGSGTVAVAVGENTSLAARTAVLTLAGLPVSVAQDGAPPPAQTVRPVSDAAGLTAALQTSGLPIQLAPGTYTGTFAVTVDGTEIRGLPVSARVTAGQQAAVVLQAADTAHAALVITASHVTVSGLTVQAVATDRAAVIVGSPSATDPLQQPDDVTLDSLEVRAAASGGKRGVEAHTRAFTLRRSLVTGFIYAGADSQAFLACNGPGPYLLEDSQLQASGENVMFGGGTIKSAAMVPTGITIRNVLLDKPQAWRLRTGTVKNSLEFKAGRNVLVEDVVIDGCWRDAQSGHAILLTPRNQNNDSPWTEVRDVVLRRVVIRNHTDGYAVQTLHVDNNAPSLPLANLTIDHCLFQSPSGVVFNGGIDGALVIADTTMPAITGAVLTFNGPIASSAKPALTFQRNVLKSGIYGVNSQYAGIGTYTFAAYLASVVNGGNVIEETVWTRWPAGTGVMLKPGELAPRLDAGFHYPGAGW